MPEDFSQHFPELSPDDLSGRILGKLSHHSNLPGHLVSCQSLAAPGREFDGVWRLALVGLDEGKGQFAPERIRHADDAAGRHSRVGIEHFLVSSATAEEAASELLGNALGNSGRDNITVIVIDVLAVTPPGQSG